MKELFAVIIAVLLSLAIAVASHRFVHIREATGEKDLIILLEIAGVAVMLALVLKKQLLHAVDHIVKLMRGEQPPAGTTWQENFDAVFTSIVFSIVIYFAFVKIAPQYF